ncbi:hypothetical protein [Kitasatospora sp. NPDC088346]|uniref:hypothetical protein n=1 Tax=Kitasatospora sp. NPDC088346 TaxID=3364073 RepID=UPI00382BB3DB
MIDDRTPPGLHFSEPSADVPVAATAPRPLPVDRAVFQPPEEDAPPPGPAARVPAARGLTFSAPGTQD